MPYFSYNTPNAAPLVSLPDRTVTYWWPPALKLIGGAMTAAPASNDHSERPVSAAYALNAPSIWPWKTRLPAVVIVPPFQNDGFGTRHTAR